MKTYISFVAKFDFELKKCVLNNIIYNFTAHERLFFNVTVSQIKFIYFLIVISWDLISFNFGLFCFVSFLGHRCIFFLLLCENLFIDFIFSVDLTVTDLAIHAITSQTAQVVWQLGCAEGSALAGFILYFCSVRFSENNTICEGTYY